MPQQHAHVGRTWTEAPDGPFRSGSRVGGGSVNIGVRRRTHSLPKLMNPYDPPLAVSTRMDRGSRIKRNAAPLLISGILILAVLVGVLSLFIPAIRTVTMPRFGWIGLLICLNPLIFLAIWFKTPVRRNLLAASFMTCAIGIINGAVLFARGTVSVVENVFNDRLYSSWFWAVLPFMVAGGYLYWLAGNSEPTLLENSVGEQNDAREISAQSVSNSQSTPRSP